VKKIGWALLAILVLVLLAAGGLVVWAEIRAYDAEPEALAAMRPDDLVDVTTDRWVVFRPKHKEPTVGFILYPGALVDPRAYSPPVRAVAAEGYLVVIVPMPLNMALFGVNSASEVIKAFTRIEQWAVGGHSLGGAMAGRFVSSHLSAVSALILWSSYVDKDISASDLACLSIYESLGGRPRNEEAEPARPLLPPATRWVLMEGGNHAQFGWYGPQRGDDEATISHEDQEGQIVRATLDFLAGLKRKGAS
jgi:hypothetical protein